MFSSFPFFFFLKEALKSGVFSVVLRGLSFFASLCFILGGGEFSARTGKLENLNSEYTALLALVPIDSFPLEEVRSRDRRILGRALYF